jgi:CDP-diacylglycerol--glycerol-3-phosphate 3-phosphatidyltransferase
MTNIYDLKPAFQDLLRPLVDRLARAGATANQVTLAARLLSLVQGAWTALSTDKTLALLLLPGTLFLRMALNAMDGMLARAYGQRSALGALLNELGDLVSDLVLYLALALVHGVSTPGLIAAVLAGLLAEFAGVCATLIDAPRRYDGPMGKSDRAFAFGLLGLLLGLGWAPDWVGLLLPWGVGLLGLTAVYNRARGALESAR